MVLKIMGCTSSSSNGNVPMKNGAVIEYANGTMRSANGNGHLDKMKGSMNDVLVDASNLDIQSAKRDLEEVGENLRDAVEESTQEMMEQLLSKDLEDKEEREAIPTPVPTLSPDPTDEDLNTTNTNEITDGETLTVVEEKIEIEVTEEPQSDPVIQTEPEKSPTIEEENAVPEAS